MATMVMISLPIVIVVLLVSSVYFGLLKLLSRRGIWRGWQTVDVLGDEISFSWSCRSNTEAATALAAAVSILVDFIPSIYPVSRIASIRFLNPESGMVLEQSCLRKITSDFGPEAARMLLGNHVEHGAVLVNDDLRLENFILDSRSPLAGALSVELPGVLQHGILSALASRYGFLMGGVLSGRSSATTSETV